MPHSAPATGTANGNTNTWEQNADFWVQIIRDDRDRYRTGLTNSAIIKSLGPVDGMRVLDAGCGEGYLARQLASRGASVLGLDSSRSLFEAARSLVPSRASSPAFDVQDVTDLDLESGSFDLVVCNHLMNDLPDPTRPTRSGSSPVSSGQAVVSRS